MPESEGIALERTRLIYPASARSGITFTVTNYTSTVYLLQSRVLPWEAATSAVDADGTKAIVTPFIVLPPLLRFPPEEAITLRIRLTQFDALPQDRESLFSLSLKAIPSQSKPGTDHETRGASMGMVLALQNNLKLFYRPEGLAVMGADARATALQFSASGGYLNITNPTPYYVTLGSLDVDNTAVSLGDRRMLAPFSSAMYDVLIKPGAEISWRVIDDEGGRTALLSRQLP
ncbi:TPA: molecular chaperone [Morganella morganii]|nr:molecular chaperone [Morganella morganii]HAT1528505.1 molecular chaperone [Morganella morganii]HDF2344540.1 molecular chaperone [Morganella morganii]